MKSEKYDTIAFHYIWPSIVLNENQVNNTLMFHVHVCFTMQMYITKIHTELIMEEVFKDKLLCAAYYLYIAKTLNLDIASIDPCTYHTLIFYK